MKKNILLTFGLLFAWSSYSQDMAFFRAEGDVEATITAFDKHTGQLTLHTDTWPVNMRLTKSLSPSATTWILVNNVAVESEYTVTAVPITESYDWTELSSSYETEQTGLWATGERSMWAKAAFGHIDDVIMDIAVKQLLGRAASTAVGWITLPMEIVSVVDDLAELSGSDAYTDIRLIDVSTGKWIENWRTPCLRDVAIVVFCRPAWILEGEWEPFTITVLDYAKAVEVEKYIAGNWGSFQAVGLVTDPEGAINWRDHFLVAKTKLLSISPGSYRFTVKEHSQSNWDGRFLSILLDRRMAKQEQSDLFRTFRRLGMGDRRSIFI